MNRFSKTVHIHVAVSDVLLKEVDAYAKAHHITRSAFVTYACMMALMGLGDKSEKEEKKEKAGKKNEV